MHPSAMPSRPTTIKDLLMKMERTISVLEENGSDIAQLREIHDGLLLSWSNGRSLTIAKATGLYWAAMSDARICLRSNTVATNRIGAVG